jgi:uncharacterized protein (DUF1501 family)
MSLPLDHEADDALAALSFPNEATPGGVSRRKFLAGLGVAGAVASFGGGGLLAKAAGAATGPNNLVVVYLGGGNDGYSTIQPTAASPLDTLRPKLLTPKSGLLPLGNGYGWSPVMPAMAQRWAAGQVAIVGNVGCSPSMSHFDAINEWLVGSPNANNGPNAGSGWIGRWLDTLGDTTDTPLVATSLTGQVPQLHVGRTTAGTGLNWSATQLFGSVRTTPADYGLFSMIEGFGEGADVTTGRGQAKAMAAAASKLAGSVGGLYNPNPSQLSSVAQGAIAARLLNNPSYGCRTVFTSLASYDLHTDLYAGENPMLVQADQLVDALFDNLQSDVAARTVALVFSEFGRRPAMNGSNGADHGTGNYAFVVGPPVKSGVYGGHLKSTGLDANGNPAISVRHYDLIGSMLRWLGAGSDTDTIIGTATTDLGLFK